jgi:Ca2+-binding RTX toxin-like protein
MSSFRRRSVRVGAVATALTLLATGAALSLAGAANAAAATVHMQGSTLIYRAAAGQANDLTISEQGFNILVDDAFEISPGTGCTAVPNDNTKALCTQFVTNVDVDVADGNDTVTKTADTGSVIRGGAGRDTIKGGPAFEDPIEGIYRSNTLIGGPDNDVLMGGPHRDLLDGGPGRDQMTGGDGPNDIVTYADRTARVVADLDGAAADDGQAGERDSIGADVEGLEGGAGNDALTGNAQPNDLRGRGGNDTLNGLAADDMLSGGEGNDQLAGGDGRDTVSYAGQTGPVTADIDGAAADDGGAGEADTIGADVENLIGTAQDDMLTGNAGPNEIDGGPGNDVTRGLDGNDTLYDRWTGEDVILGGAGNDTLWGSEGADVLKGEAGVDILHGGRGYDFLDGGEHANGNTCLTEEDGGTTYRCEPIIGLR